MNDAIAIERPPADEYCAVANAIVHLPTGLREPPTPAFFATAVSPVAYDENAGEPKNWLQFLNTLWPDDIETQEALGEWFGYILGGRTEQQKILMLVGPPRAGKGTITRILTALVGPDNTCGPTLANLAGPFGLATLVGKSLAIVSEAKLSNRSDKAAVVENLLMISGEDSVTADRKHQLPWHGRLPTRFILSTNEPPSLVDTSGAFANRLIILQFRRTFLGSEDLGLEARLRSELSGILSWAVAGWQRLHQRGRFVQPASAEDMVGLVRDTSSETGKFVREMCDVGPDFQVERGALYEAYRAWRKEEGLDGAVAQGIFGKRLRAVLPEIKESQPRRDGTRQRLYLGIAISATGQGALDV